MLKDFLQAKKPTSVKANTNIYHTTREELNLKREKASEILEGLPPERIEKIENSEVIGNGLLAGMPVIKPIEVKETKESAFSSLFDTPKEEVKDDLNDLFGSSSNQNAVNSDSFVSANNVQLAVNDVKDVIRTYQEKGYTVFCSYIQEKGIRQ